MFFKTLDQSAFKSHITYLETGRRVNDKIQNAIKLKRANVLNPGCNCLLAQLCLTLCNPMDCSPPGSSVHGDPSWPEWNGLPFPPSGDLSNPGIELRFPALQADSLPSGSPGKPKNTRVGSLSLLQGTFPTQESNQGLPH